jgi:hypothetical protein
MTTIRITPRIGAVVVAGLVLANSAAVAQPAPAAPPPNPVPAAQPVPGPTPRDAAASRGSASPAAGQAGTTPTAVPHAVPASAVSRLDADTEEDIREELLDMKEDSGSASAAVLRPKLMAKAESMAAESPGMTSRLAQHPTIRLQLRAIVRSVLSTATTTPSSGKGQTPPSEAKRTRKSADDDGDSRRRCDCIYCQPSRHTGACSSSCPTPCLPTLPTAGCYTATPYYLVPYAYSPKHQCLHGLLCPYTWCRGRW